jgi:hypothetical protein
MRVVLRKCSDIAFILGAGWRAVLDLPRQNVADQLA